MNTILYILVAVIVILFIMIAVNMFYDKKKSQNENFGVNLNHDEDNLRAISYKMIIPLKIQAYERLLLYIERIQFSVLVKRIYQAGMSRDDFQFSLLQNVQDELEHNLAQRLYVSEETWQLICLSKEEVLQNINAVFADNETVDVSAIAQKIISFENPIVEKAVISIKREFNAL